MIGTGIVISGGGTAGHLYPALALGGRLQEKIPEAKITYVGSSRVLEQKIMQHSQADFFSLRIEGIKGRGWKTLRAVLLLPRAFWQAFRLLRRLRPQLVVGVGGYSAGPVVLLASWMKIPTLILEQNRRPGLTNRWLLPFVDKAVAAFESSLPEFKGKGIFLGNPVRQEFYHLAAKPRGGRLTVLIFGGSQGSHFLNQAVAAALPQLSEHKEQLQIIHQTGERDLEEVRKSYERHGYEAVTVAPYFFDMPEQFRKSDLIVCRAGASTIAELIAARKASLLVPFAAAADDHQTQNARELEKIEGARVLSEQEFTPQALSDFIRELIQDHDQITRMENNLTRLGGNPDVADRIADLCLNLMKERRT
jgi:UDP-N-acetylglucosamine--N-acetylmuramyl-(pentapeptide) pyrophosphoryl-undecaprenol N-acetylglucosamine transferase